MKPQHGLRGISIPSFVCIVSLSCLGGGAYAAPLELPGGATPGGALPLLDKIPKLRRDKEPEVPPPGQEKVPVIPESGVRMVIQAFVLDGVIDRPERGITRDDLDRRIEAIRITHTRGFTISELQEVTDEITRIYRTAGYILARAYIPEQEVADGRVMIRILEGQLEKVTFQNNHGYSEQTLSKPFNGLVGQPVNRDEVERALLELSDYPGLKFNSVFSPGDTMGTAKLGVNVEGEKKFEGVVWLDNYGSEYTGEYRLWIDAALNNPTGVADRLAAQLLTSFGDKTGNSGYYALGYQRPVFSPRNILGVDISKNAFQVGGIFADLDLVGESTTMSASLRRKFIRSRDMNLDGRVILSTKSSSTDISGTSLGEDALTVITLGGTADFRDRWSGYSQAALNYSMGLPGVLGAMDEEGDGNSSRTDATGEHAGGNFSKINLSLARWQALNFTPKFINQTLLARLEVQSSNDLLVSMEQMSLGGPSSVRAYPPSEYLVDNGYFLSMEWIAKSNNEASKGKFFEDLQFSVFYDYASGELNDPLVNDFNSPKLQGIGASAQIAPQKTYFARLDLAKPIGDPEPSNNRGIQYFFKLGYLF